MFAKSNFKKTQMWMKSKSLWLEVAVRVSLVILFVWVVFPIDWNVSVKTNDFIIDFTE